MKLKLGATMDRRDLTYLYASSMDRVECFIMYAITMVADLDTPAWQCTSAFPPRFLTPSAKKKWYASEFSVLDILNIVNKYHL